MGRHKIKSSDHTQGQRFSAALGLWLAALALLFQLLTPLAPARAELNADGLFPAVCGFHDADSATDGGDATAGQHCPLCQVQAFDRLILPVRLAVPAFSAPVVGPGWPEPADGVPLRAASVPPLPSRGPPSVA